MLSKMISLQQAHSLRTANPLALFTSVPWSLQGCVLQGRTRLFVSIGSRFSWDLSHVFVHRQTRALLDLYTEYSSGPYSYMITYCVQLTRMQCMQLSHTQNYMVNNMHTGICDLVRRHYTLPHHDLSHGLIQHMRVTTTTLSSSTTFLLVSDCYTAFGRRVSLYLQTSKNVSCGI